MKISIRKAEIFDSPSITELSFELGYPSEVRTIKNRLEKIIGHPEHLVLVALQNDHLIAWIQAFLTFRVESNPFVEIGGIVVKESFQGKGIGKKLVEEIKPWAKKSGVHSIRVRTNVIRKEAHQFYEKLGFEFRKEQKIFDLDLS